MMLQRKGLLSVVGAILVFAVVSLALPSAAMAQSQQAVRVQIQKVDGPEQAVFGDVLLVKDGTDIVLYGLAQSVPSQSQVNVTVASGEIKRNASFGGKFPIRHENPIRVPATESGADIAVTFPTSSGMQNATGSISFNFDGDTVRRDLPHRLIQIQEETSTATPQVGYVLLTQRLIGTGEDAYIVDQFEGLSDSGSAFQLQSVPQFATVEVYSEKIDVNNPDRTKRLTSFGTDSYFEGQFISNGSFFPFSVMDANSGNTASIPSVLWLRIVPPTGLPFLARINNDVNAEVDGDVTVITNNDQANPNKPGDRGVAVLAGQATDAYALITAYAANSTDSAVLAQTLADGDGQFELIVPASYTAEGIYFQQTEAFLDVMDNFGNRAAGLKAYSLDTEAMIFESAVATDQGLGIYTISAVVEPAAMVIVHALLLDGSVADFAGTTLADAAGQVSMDVTAAAKYLIRYIDQGGNEIQETIDGKTSTSDPTNLAFAVAYPNIIITGNSEPSAFIQIYAHYLDQVPDTAQTFETQPDGTFFLKAGRANPDGSFSIAIPAGLASQVIYVQAVDVYGIPGRYVGFELVDPITGEPINQALIAFDSVTVINNGRELDDVINAKVVNSTDKSPVTGVVVNAYATMIPESEFIFYGPMTEFGTTVVAADGSFSLTIPDRDPLTNMIISTVYLVAFDPNTMAPLGFEQVDADDGFYRVGPAIGDYTNPPLNADLVLKEYGKGKSDMLNVNRIYPANTPGGNITQILNSGAIPFVFVIVDSNDDAFINVLDSDITILAYQPLYVQAGIPFPGAPAIDLGENYWDPNTQTIVGRTNVFVALMDAYGNLSPDPIHIELDTYTQNPDASLISVEGRQIIGLVGAVESRSKVTFYKDAACTEWVGVVHGTEEGSFYLSGITLQENAIYAVSEDLAGNKSQVVKLKVVDPVVNQFMVLDAFNALHTPSGTITGNADITSNAVAFDAADDEQAVYYQLNADGSIYKMGPKGKLPFAYETFSIPGGFARDLDVVKSDPFQAYVLLGNGVIITLGGAPFFGDMATLEKGYTTIPNRILVPQTQFRFEDVIIVNGKRDTEDKNNNGILDIVIGLDGKILYNEDTGIGTSGFGAGNGILDSEPLIDPANLGMGFYTDIARDLELVKDNDGNVKGYVILDGTGVMWAFGTDIGAENVKPAMTNGYTNYDIFRDLELIVEDGKIVDFITMNGYGQLFALPGGPLGAGPVDPVNDPANAFTGYLSADKLGLITYMFDIARDLELSPIDTNGDAVVDYKDGFFILTGFGTIQAIGGALEIENTPFLGFDIARDLEFGTVLPQ